MIGSVDARAKERWPQIVASLQERGGKALAGEIAQDVGLSVRLTCVGLNGLVDLGVVQSSWVRRGSLGQRPAWRLQDWAKDLADSGLSHEQIMAQAKSRAMRGVKIYKSREDRTT